MCRSRCAGIRQWALDRALVKSEDFVRSAAGGVSLSWGRAAAASAQSGSTAGSTPSSRSVAGAGVPRGCAARLPPRPPRRRRRARRSPLGKRHASASMRVREHRRVRRAVPHPGDADERLGQHVVQRRARCCRARSPRAASRAPAGRGPARHPPSRRTAGARPRARRASRPGSRWSRTAPRPRGPARSASSRQVPRAAGRRRAPGRRSRRRAARAGWTCPRRAACRWMRVISAPDKVVGDRHRSGGVRHCAATSAFATSMTRPPPKATIRSPKGRAGRRPAGRRARARRCAPCPRPRPRPARRPVRAPSSAACSPVHRASRPRPRRTAPEDDRAFAVDPAELTHRQGPRTRSTRSSGRRGRARAS